MVVTESTTTESFDGFVRRVETRLREALSATLGSQVGREAAADALAYAWEHWDRVRDMENPAGYLYVVGRDRGRKAVARGTPVLLSVDPARTPWVEPGLPGALADLPDNQRIVVMLLHCFQWTMSEVAELLDVSKSTVQTHADRGMAKLRSKMGVAT